MSQKGPSQEAAPLPTDLTLTLPKSQGFTLGQADGPSTLLQGNVPTKGLLSG